MTDPYGFWGPHKCFVRGVLPPDQLRACQEGEYGSDPASAEIPVQVTGVPPMASVHAGVFAAFAVDTSGRLWNWGANYAYELALGISDYLHIQSQPVEVEALSRIVSVASYSAFASGYSIFAAIDVQGHVWIWGGEGEHAPTTLDGRALRVLGWRGLVGLGGNRCTVGGQRRIECYTGRSDAVEQADGNTHFEVRIDGSVWRGPFHGARSQVVFAPDNASFNLVASATNPAPPLLAAASPHVLTTVSIGPPPGGGPAEIVATVLNAGPYTAAGVQVTVSLSRPVDGLVLPSGCSGTMEIACAIEGMRALESIALRFTAPALGSGDLVVSAGAWSDASVRWQESLGIASADSAWYVPQSGGTPLPQVVPFPAWSLMATTAALALIAARPSRRRAARSR